LIVSSRPATSAFSHALTFGARSHGSAASTAKAQADESQTRAPITHRSGLAYVAVAVISLGWVKRSLGLMWKGRKQIREERREASKQVTREPKRK
jgi:hypothetical protein